MSLRHPVTMVCLCMCLCEKERGERECMWGREEQRKCVVGMRRGEKVYCSLLMMVCSCMCLCERGEERRCIVAY